MRKVITKSVKENASDYVGREGELFFDPRSNQLRRSGGENQGGNIIGGTANTGDITFNQNRIIGAGEDGRLGYNTINLVPDASLLGSGQYITIDSTAPQHVHVRAGAWNLPHSVLD